MKIHEYGVRRRKALDPDGNPVEILERRDPGHHSLTSDRPNGHNDAPKFFGPDGRPLVPEGHGFFRNPFGVRYKTVD